MNTSELYKYVANTFIDLSLSENIEVTNMKLQKLMYFFYKDYCQKNEKPPFEQKFEAWQYGPVLQELYDKISTYGKKPIDNFIKDCDGNYFGIGINNDKIYSCIINVWVKLKYYNALTLSDFTHQNHGAWKKAREENLREIPVDYVIKEDDLVDGR